MSGYTGEAVLDVPEQAGALEFIQKPFASRALIGRLRAMLER
jgi:FixJ family two-component response regulator